MSSINVAEAIKVLQRKGFSHDEAIISINTLVGETVLYGKKEAHNSTDFEDVAKRYGLSFGDCACLSLARERSLPAVTADTAWQKAGEELSVTVRLIR